MNTIVIDANIALSCVIPLSYSEIVINRMKEWQSEKVKIIVPTLWHYEVLSGLRKAISMKILTREKVGIVLDELHELDETARWQYAATWYFTNNAVLSGGNGL